MSFEEKTPCLELTITRADETQSSASRHTFSQLLEAAAQSLTLNQAQEYFEGIMQHTDRLPMRIARALIKQLEKTMIKDNRRNTLVFLERVNSTLKNIPKKCHEVIFIPQQFQSPQSTDHYYIPFTLQRCEAFTPLFKNTDDISYSMPSKKSFELRVEATNHPFKTSIIHLAHLLIACVDAYPQARITIQENFLYTEDLINYLEAYKKLYEKLQLNITVQMTVKGSPKNASKEKTETAFKHLFETEHTLAPSLAFKK